MKSMIQVERSKTGLPCLWESGGGNTNTGAATIVAAGNGGPKRAIYVRRNGPRANFQHALIPISAGDLIVQASQHRLDYDIDIYVIDQIKNDVAEVNLLNHFSEGEWDSKLDPAYDEAVACAEEKARCYHCRETHFACEGGE